MKLIYLKSGLKCDSLHATISIKLRFLQFRLLLSRVAPYYSSLPQTLWQWKRKCFAIFKKDNNDLPLLLRLARAQGGGLRSRPLPPKFCEIYNFPMVFRISGKSRTFIKNLDTCVNLFWGDFTACNYSVKSLPNY